MLNDEIREQRRSLKGKGVAAHLQYFWDYYKVTVLVILAAAALVIYAAVSILGKKESALRVIFLNAENRLTETEEKMRNDFADYAGIDQNSRSIELSLSMTQNEGGGTGTTYDMATQMTIDAEIQSHGLDAIVCNPENFQYYATLSEFVDVRTVLDASEIEQYEAYFYYVDVTELEKVQDAIQNMNYEALETEAEDAEVEDTVNPENTGFLGTDPKIMNDPVPIGIRVTEASYIKENEIFGGGTAIMGFTMNSERTETAAEFLAFLFAKSQD